MTPEDPFFAVKTEVISSLDKARNLYEKWADLQYLQSPSSQKDFDQVSTELRNSLRSIEWDLEDLEETISIVESNPQKFNIQYSEIKERKTFISSTKEEVALMKKAISQVTGRNSSSEKYSDRQTVASYLSYPDPNTNPYGATTEVPEVDLGQSTRSRGESFVRKMSNSLSDLANSTRRDDDLTVSMMDHEGGQYNGDEGEVVIVTGSRIDYLYKRASQHLRTKSKRSTFIAFAITTFIIVTIVIYVIIK